MARLTFTVDDEIVDSLEMVREQAHDLRQAIATLEESAGALESWEFVRPVAEALDRLSGEVSTAAVLRESVGSFLATLREIEMRARLEMGYRELARDEERAAVIAAMRVPDRWADEP